MLANNYQSCICFFSFSEKKQKISWNIGIFFYKDDVPHGKHSGKPKKVEKLSWSGKEVMTVSIIWLTNKDKDWLTWQTNIQRLTDRHSLSVSFCNTDISDKRTVFSQGIILLSMVTISVRRIFEYIQRFCSEYWYSYW